MKKFNFSTHFNLTTARLLVLVAGILALVLVGVIVLLFPKIKNNYDSYEKEKEAVSRLKTKAAALDSFVEQMSLLKQEDTVLHNVLPEEIDIPNFMGRISKVATDSAVLIDSFQLVSEGRPASSKATRSSKAVNFSLTVSGSYQEILSYVTNLENFASIVDFSNVTITNVEALDTSGEPSSSNSLSADFSLSAYYFPSRAENPNLDDKIDFSLDSNSFKEIMSKAKGMVYWKAEQYQSPVGKSNPFLR